MSPPEFPSNALDAAIETGLQRQNTEQALKSISNWSEKILDHLQNLNPSISKKVEFRKNNVKQIVLKHRKNE